MEENIINIGIWITENPYYSLTIGITIAEAITRLTPTKKDDGFVQRAGEWIKFILDKIHTPNLKK